MKSALLVSTGAFFIALASCSPAADPPKVNGTGGKSATGGASSGSGGASSSGGSTGSGGSSSTGGSTGSGGSADTGGSGAETGGSTGSGGATGTGGGGGPRTGGTTGSGGAAGGGNGSGGSTGTGGAGGGGMGNLMSVVGALDGYLYTAQCGDGGTGFDCLNSGCMGSAKTVTMDFPIGGTMGAKYDVTINVKGVVEAKNYSGCMRRAGTDMTFTAGGGDFWCVGGTIPNSTYNTYELNVFPTATGGTAEGYRLNARNGTGEGHESWPLNFNATFRVTGGGRIQFRSYDSNCRMIMNCGPGGGGATCRAPVTLSLAGAMPAAPATFTQPFKGTQANAFGQWVFIDVTNVVLVP